MDKITGPQSANDCSSPIHEEAPSPYTAFTRQQKRLLIVLLGFATITSPLTATIYFPLLPILREHFNTTAQAINLTLTIYIVFQAISPAIFGPLSDSMGRRPVYFLTLCLYMAANLGLALNRNHYGALLGLRAIQSLGASAAYAISFGVVADVCVPSERGRMLGPVSMALNLGACIGPVVGGWVAYSSGSFEWVFWALVIASGLLLFLVGGFLPETARSLVGNGEKRVTLPWWYWTWLELVTRLLRRGREKRLSESGTHEHSLSIEAETPRKFRVGNPLACLRIIFHLDTFFVLWMHGSFYTVDYSLVAATPDIYKQIYHFNEVQIGLTYLPRGVGIIVGGYCIGKVMDYNYKATARKINWIIDSVSGDNLKDFPIERARARGSGWLLLVSTIGLIGYGWTVHYQVHISILLILQFMQGLWGTCFYTVYNTLLVDAFPESPSTAAAAASITRCAMAATGIAVLQPLLDAAGRGWYFTVLGLWSGSFGAVAVWCIKNKGMKWRKRRLDKHKMGNHIPCALPTGRP
jgi:multidrug resistance protein